MAFFELNSDIQIGDFHFSGVHRVVIRKSVHSYADTATLTIPAICKVRKSNDVSGYQPTAGLLSDRDPVRVSLGYNGDLQEEFRGFVKRRSLSYPMQVECEGMVQVMRLDMDVSASYEVTSAAVLGKFLQSDAYGNDSGITVEVADNLPLQNIVLSHVNGVEICNAIKRFSVDTMSIFFKGATTLWMGLLYSTLKQGSDPLGLGVVNFRIGYNTLAANELREHTASDPVEIVFHNFSATGVRQQVLSAADVKARARKEVAIMNNIGDADTLQKIANEKMYRSNYVGYSGVIRAFLQPFCAPGWIARITDDRYPERNGDYLIESTEVSFGAGGARRRVEVGPKMGFSI